MLRMLCSSSHLWLLARYTTTTISNLSTDCFAGKNAFDVIHLYICFFIASNFAFSTRYWWYAEKSPSFVERSTLFNVAMHLSSPCEELYFPSCVFRFFIFVSLNPLTSFIIHFLNCHLSWVIVFTDFCWSFSFGRSQTPSTALYWS
jgi:hypothetical protein